MPPRRTRFYTQSVFILPDSRPRKRISRALTTAGSSYRESIGRNSFRDKLFRRSTYLRREFLRHAGEYGSDARICRLAGTVILAFSRNEYSHFRLLHAISFSPSSRDRSISIVTSDSIFNRRHVKYYVLSYTYRIVIWIITSCT